MKIKPVFLAGVLASILLYSCTFTNVEELAPDCRPQSASFNDTVFQIFQRYCWDTANGACHQAGATNKPEWVSHGNISGLKDRIRARALDEKSMPPPFAPPEKLAISDCERNIIRKWMDEGAKNN